MKKIFCQGVGNAQLFLNGIDELKKRGAVEASWLFVMAEPGLGKSNTLEWYSAQYDVPLIRAKAGWSVNWALKDIAKELGLEPKGKSQLNFQIIVDEIMDRQRSGPVILIVDEINHIAKKIDVLETLRDLTDLTQMMLIAGGHKDTETALKPHKQIYSRITEFVKFSFCTVEDVRLIYDAMCEVPVTDCAVAEIHRQAGGIHRQIMNTIVRVEAIGKRTRGEAVSAEIIGNRRLNNDRNVGDNS